MQLPKVIATSMLMLPFPVVVSSLPLHSRNVVDLRSRSTVDHRRKLEKVDMISANPFESQGGVEIYQA